MKKTTNFTPIAAAVIAMAALGGAAHAGEQIDLGDGLKLDWRLNTTYSIGQRLNAPDAVLTDTVKNGQANDGNNNFKKNALTTNRLGLLLETKLSKGQSGFVLSGSTFYDDVYHSKNDNKNVAGNPNVVNKSAPYDEFTAGTKRFHGGFSRILDAYGYTSFDLGDSGSRATVRLGRHAVNWGEATFFPNIAAAQGPFDGTKTGVAGAEVKDTILPEDQVSMSIEINPNWSLLAHAQYGFHETIAPATGSYLSTSDVVGPGSSCMYQVGAACYLNRQTDVKPSQTGQWGIGTRFRVSDETEVGVYYLDYKDRTPLPVITGAGKYAVKFHDDVKMLAATASTTFGVVSAYGELSLRKDTPIVAVISSAPVIKRADAVHLNVGGMWNVGRTPIADTMQILGEISHASYSGYGVPVSTLANKTDKGTAIAGVISLSYPGVFEGWDLAVPLRYQQQLKGRTLVNSSMGEGDKRVSIGASFTRLGNLNIAITYDGFLGKPSLDATKYRALTDRDQLSMTVKYSF